MQKNQFNYITALILQQILCSVKGAILMNNLILTFKALLKMSWLLAPGFVLMVLGCYFELNNKNIRKGVR
jgi:hypothetical protein